MPIRTWLLSLIDPRKKQKMLLIKGAFLFVLHFINSMVVSRGMLKIRLQRTGRKNEPHFRVVVAEHTKSPPSGRYVEMLGSYNPKAGTVTIDKERAQYWIKNGAQTSGTVHNFLVSQKVIEGKKINVLPKKSSTVKRKELKKK